MINAYMTDDITVKITSRGTWGTVTTTNSTIKGRFEFRTKLVRNFQGEQVVASAKVYLPIMVIGHKDKITYAGVEYDILNIEIVKDFSARYLKLDVA